MKDRFEFRLEGVEALLLQGKKIDMAELPMEEVRQCYEFLKGFASEKVIYGINTGFGPMAQWRVDDQYLIDLRLEAAARRMKESDLPVSRIVQEVHFAGEYMFYRRFRQKYGMTPAEYRRLHANENA